MRINRFLAQAGLGSRRACEGLVGEGRVQINGEPVSNLATTVADGDRVTVDGRTVGANAFRYYILNKPRGFHCTASDPSGRKTVFDLLPDDAPRLFYVGRLDAESEGMLILTNDGAMTQRLTHPSNHVEKEYEAHLDKPLVAGDIERLLKGMRLEEGRASMKRVTAEGARARCVLEQGLKRQVRRMFYSVGYEVLRLRRIRIGELWMGKLPVGGCRPLSRAELDLLRPGKTG